MYAMVGTRPDLAYPLSVLGRFAASPDTFHLAMAKQVLRYVKSTLTLKLKFPGTKSSGSTSPLLCDFVDSDYANSNNPKSVTDLCFFLSECLIYWASKRQSTVATSTTVAEYFALYEATTETVCLCSLLKDLHLPQPGTTVIYEDNQSAIRLADNETSHKRTKHIAVKYHYTKEQQDFGSITIRYVASEDNLADFFTKPLACIQHQAGCKHLTLSG
jgi:hypothetical protein